MWSISKKFSLSDELILAANPGQNENITAGQVLKIPDRIIEYRVKRGDNISKIARDHNLKVDIVRKINKDNDLLNEGRVLNLPLFETSRKALDKTSSVPKAIAYNQKKAGNYGNVNIRKDALTAPVPDFKDKNLSLPVNIDEIRDVRNNGRGIIVFLKTGSPVKSIQKGVVEFSSSMSGYNNVIIISYGDQLYAVYGFLGKMLVHEGETVLKDQMIGNSGNVDSNGNQGFYLEMRYGRKSLNIKDFYPAFNMKEYALKVSPVLQIRYAI